jgi:phage terminase large subunit-like protein
LIHTAAVAERFYHGDSGVLEATDHAKELATTYKVVEVAFDPWRFGAPAQELGRGRLLLLEFPQTDVHMVPASDRLYRAIVEQRLVLPDNHELRQHAATGIAGHPRRGWRLDKAHRSDNIDALIALAMALTRAENQPEPVELIGWL